MIVCDAMVFQSVTAFCAIADAETNRTVSRNDAERIRKIMAPSF